MSVYAHAFRPAGLLLLIVIIPFSRAVGLNPICWLLTRRGRDVGSIGCGPFAAGPVQ